MTGRHHRSVCELDIAPPRGTVAEPQRLITLDDCGTVRGDDDLSCMVLAKRYNA